MTGIGSNSVDSPEIVDASAETEATGWNCKVTDDEDVRYGRFMTMRLLIQATTLMYRHSKRGGESLGTTWVSFIQCDGVPLR